MLYLSEDQVRSVATTAAGAASMPFMEDHPRYVMPAERVIEGVEAVVDEFLEAQRSDEEAR